MTDRSPPYAEWQRHRDARDAAYAAMDGEAGWAASAALDAEAGQQIAAMVEIEGAMLARPATSAVGIADKLTVALANAAEVTDPGAEIDANWRLVAAALADLRGQITAPAA